MCTSKLLFFIFVCYILPFRVATEEACGIITFNMEAKSFMISCRKSCDSANPPTRNRYFKSVKTQ